MQQLQQQQQQQQQQQHLQQHQQQLGGLGNRLPTDLPFPELHQQLQQRQSPPPLPAGLQQAGAAGILEGMLRAAAVSQQHISQQYAGGAGSPPPLPADRQLPHNGEGPEIQAGRQPVRPGVMPARKPGAQHVPKPTQVGRENRCGVRGGQRY